MYVIEGDTSRAKGMADELLRLAALVKPYDGLGPHLRPIPTGPNGRGSPRKSTPQTPVWTSAGCPGRSARWDGVRGVQAGFPCWGVPITPLSQRHGRLTRSPHRHGSHVTHFVRWAGHIEVSLRKHISLVRDAVLCEAYQS